MPTFPWATSVKIPPSQSPMSSSPATSSVTTTSSGSPPLTNPTSEVGVVKYHVIDTLNHVMSSGREDDDYRLITDTEEGRSVELNNPGAYPTCCVELSLDGLSVNTVLQSQVGVAWIT